ncbi:hypothetical protein SD457_06160 [Coprobacillaceae bacterium CR2/5/TPMF4]|nr:hypothetical protein SD457_06160 [Coprobacillaceae bacterium CR2/5/TPMF4]
MGGEEGRELVVHDDGTWNTIGDNGAEFLIMNLLTLFLTISKQKIY